MNLVCDEISASGLGYIDSQKSEICILFIHFFYWFRARLDRFSVQNTVYDPLMVSFMFYDPSDQ